MAITHRFKGNDTGEFFPGLPKRDLTDEDVKSFTDRQMEILKSPAGKRLYVPSGRSSESGASKNSEKSGEKSHSAEVSNGN